MDRAERSAKLKDSCIARLVTDSNLPFTVNGFRGLDTCTIEIADNIA